MFKSIFTKAYRRFSHSRVQVILVEDYPSLGFEGQIVSVKPGYAESVLIPKKIAVYNFPGVHERLYPNWDELSVEKKKEEYEMIQFTNKLENMSLEILRPASTTNPNFLKEPLKVRDIMEQARIKLNIELQPNNIRLIDEIVRYGVYRIDIDEYFSEKFKKKFNFKLKLNVKKGG